MGKDHVKKKKKEAEEADQKRQRKKEEKAKRKKKEKKEGKEKREKKEGEKKKEKKKKKKEKERREKKEKKRAAEETLVDLCEEMRLMRAELAAVKSALTGLRTEVRQVVQLETSRSRGGPRQLPAVKTVWINARYKMHELTFHRQIWKELGLNIVQSAVPPPDWTVRWSMRLQMGDWASFEPWHKTNFVPGIQNLIRKDNLHRALTAMQRRFGKDNFDFWPESYALPLEWTDFAKRGAERPNDAWILKPPAASCGRKIRVGASFKDLHVTAHDDWILNNRPVAQEYLETPLIEGHKFTLRIYVVVTGLDPLRVYIYEDGLCRIASRPYSTAKDSFDDPLVHLDSIDINDKNSEDVHFSVPTLETQGLRSTVRRVLDHLEKTEGADKQKLWREICQVVVKSVLSAEQDMLMGVRTLVKNRGSCFDLLGYDILLTRDVHKPYVIEINHSPSMAPLTEMENVVKRGMLSSYMRLADVALADREPLRASVKKLMTQFKDETKSKYAVTDYAVLEEKQQMDAGRLSDSDFFALANLELESKRAGGFERIFPCKDMREVYGPFYQKNRNVLAQLALNKKIDGLAQWE